MPRRLIRALTLSALRPLRLALTLRLTRIVSFVKWVPFGRRTRIMKVRRLRQCLAGGSWKMRAPSASPVRSGPSGPAGGAPGIDVDGTAGVAGRGVGVGVGV